MHPSVAPAPPSATAAVLPAVEVADLRRRYGDFEAIRECPSRSGRVRCSRCSA